MGYINATGIFSFLAIMLICISIVVKYESKRVLFNNFILRHKKERYKLSDLFRKMIRPIMPSKIQIDEVRKYVENQGKKSDQLKLFEFS